MSLDLLTANESQQAELPPPDHVSLRYKLDYSRTNVTLPLDVQDQQDPLHPVRASCCMFRDESSLACGRMNVWAGRSGMANAARWLGRDA